MGHFITSDCRVASYSGQGRLGFGPLNSPKLTRLQIGSKSDATCCRNVPVNHDEVVRQGG